MGFAQSAAAGDGLLVETASKAALCVAISARHSALAHARVPLDQLRRYPLVMGDTRSCEGCGRRVERLCTASVGFGQDDAPNLPEGRQCSRGAED